LYDMDGHEFAMLSSAKRDVLHLLDHIIGLGQGIL
jgi:hypothetical protein